MSNLEEYQNYVNDIKLSTAGSSVTELIKSIDTNYVDGVDICRLLCGAIGQSSECGELFKEVLLGMSPKVVDELGDVLFYTMVSARSLDIQLSKGYTLTKELSKTSLLEYVQDLSIVTAEYLDIIKKVLFQGKRVDQNILIDKIWYQYSLIENIAIKLDVPIEYVISVNKNKLDRRYKLMFTVDESENKK